MANVVIYDVASYDLVIDDVAIQHLTMLKQREDKITKGSIPLQLVPNDAKIFHDG